MIDRQKVSALLHAISIADNENAVRRRSGVYAIRNLLDLVPAVAELSTSQEVIASYAPGVGDLFGIAEAAFSFGTSLTTDSSGNASTSLMTTAGQLQEQLAQRFIAQAAASGTQFDLIYQDWGKVNTLGALLAAAQQGSPWYWNGSSTAASVLQGMQPAIEESYYGV
jgi:hypothetical protein